MTSQDTRQQGTAKSGFFPGYIVVIAAFFIMAIMWGTFHAFGVFFNPVLAEFGWTRAMTSGAFSLSLIISGFSAILMGRLTDKIGPRLVLTICGFLLGVGYLLISQVTAVWHLYILYGIVIGIAMGGSWVPLMTTVARWFSARRSLFTGIVLAGLGIGGLIGPPLASWFISTYDWRTSYAIIGGLSLVIVIIAAQFLKRDPSQIGLVPYGADRAAESEPHQHTEGLSFNEALRSGTFWLFFFALFTFGFCLYAIMVHIAPHAIDLGISDSSAANILALIGGMGILGMILLGGAADRIGNRWGFAIGLALMAIPLFLLIPARQEWLIYLLTAIFGFGHGGFASSESPLAARLFGLKAHGTILGTAVLGFSIGAGIGPVVTGYIFDVTSSYQLAFVCAASVAIIGIIITAVLRPARKS
jgi:OFA family oxalate/formate antiporter-like MFS transporter